MKLSIITSLTLLLAGSFASANKFECRTSNSFVMTFQLSKQQGLTNISAQAQRVNLPDASAYKSLPPTRNFQANLAIIRDLLEMAKFPGRNGSIDNDPVLFVAAPGLDPAKGLNLNQWIDSLVYTKTPVGSIVVAFHDKMAAYHNGLYFHQCKPL